MPSRYTQLLMRYLQRQQRLGFPDGALTIEYRTLPDPDGMGDRYQMYLSNAYMMFDASLRAESILRSLPQLQTASTPATTGPFCYYYGKPALTASLETAWHTWLYDHQHDATTPLTPQNLLTTELDGTLAQILTGPDFQTKLNTRFIRLVTGKRMLDEDLTLSMHPLGRVLILREDKPLGFIMPIGLRETRGRAKLCMACHGTGSPVEAPVLQPALL